MSTIPVALQLYAVRNECAADLPRTLENVAKIGYQGAEPWGYDGRTLEWQGHPVQDVRRFYDDNGLTCCGIHLSTSALSEENLARTVEFNKILGNHFLIVAMDKERMSSVAGVAELAGILNDVAEKLTPEGLFTGYHAHGFDAAVLENGEVAWDMLFTQTNPAVIMQMDVGNYASGGGDSIGMLRKFPGRAKTVHLKEYGATSPDAVIGDGTMDWPEVFRLCEETQGTEWYVVEEGNGTGFDIPRRSREALRKMGR